VLDGGRAVRAQVIDDGPGVSPEALPRVFEPFFTTKEVGVGTGLGLSVSYGIIEEHGGRLTVASAPGETVFTLELPVGAPAGSPAAPGAAAAAPFAAAGRAALVVEDEPGVADLVASLLRDTGWRVDVAPGGRAGLARVRERRYDLIVSDIRMPDGSGEDFYREAVQGDPALGGRFLIITGDTANARALEFVKRQKLPVLEKPFAPDRFLEAVRRVASSLTASGSSA
ncbi:MAG: response regulator, partial [Candidatus Rokubacteria bacterium]|nr:response regulator [Candidatus Rokubacteria bacterium]